MIRAQTPRFCHLWAFPHGQVDPFPTIEILHRSILSVVKAISALGLAVKDWNKSSRRPISAR